MHTEPALIPEFAVSDWQDSRRFYTDLLGFTELYARPEEGFSMLALGAAQVMIGQLDLGRTFDDGHAPTERPFGRGVNLQIRAPDLDAIVARLAAAETALYLPLEERWYRRDDVELGNRQCVVADPDGYLLRFFEDIGTRPA